MSDYSTSSGCYLLKNVHERVTASKMTVYFNRMAKKISLFVTHI